MLNLFGNTENNMFVEVTADDLHSDWQVVYNTARNADGWMAGCAKLGSVTNHLHSEGNFVLDSTVGWWDKRRAKWCGRHNRRVLRHRHL